MLKKYFILVSLVLFFVLTGQPVFARDIQNLTDWYIQNFTTSITVNQDSSLLITERITADCGNLPNKHGIFRVLPVQTNAGGEVFKTPIELVSITDFNNNPYNYQTIKDNFNKTVTWKIGDSNITVRGVNYYKIVYKVKNAVRFGNKNFDELYWNLLGDFWDIGIDNFSAQIFFPNGITSKNTEVNYYTGMHGSKDRGLAAYFWGLDNTLNFNSVYGFQPREGVTVSVTFPKNIFTPYASSFVEKYGDYFWYLSFIVPIGIFVFAFKKWRKYGKDPKMKKPIPPEFGIPNDISPIQMGMVLSHGRWKNNFITATIVNLAVKKFITIEQKEEKVLFFTNKVIILNKNADNSGQGQLTKTESDLLGRLFWFKKDSVKLSDLKNNFYQYIPAIKKSATKDVVDKGWISKDGNKYAGIFIASSLFVAWLSVWFLALAPALFASIITSATILFVFGLVMPKRTQEGVDLLFKIKGFELYMKTAENYRQQFYEKENIFDKFLPYAMVFGIAELWAKKMELIYGEDYFKNYHPVWFVGGSASNFNLNSFTSQLNSISSSISSSTHGSSGSGGGGFSGGGGGGGGGGGW